MDLGGLQNAFKIHCGEVVFGDGGFCVMLNII
jgi:hypothetical protein